MEITEKTFKSAGYSPGAFIEKLTGFSDLPSILSQMTSVRDLARSSVIQIASSDHHKFQQEAMRLGTVPHEVEIELERLKSVLEELQSLIEIVSARGSEVDEAIRAYELFKVNYSSLLIENDVLALLEDLILALNESKKQPSIQGQEGGVDSMAVLTDSSEIVKKILFHGLPNDPKQPLATDPKILEIFEEQKELVVGLAMSHLWSMSGQMDPSIDKDDLYERYSRIVSVYVAIGERDRVYRDIRELILGSLDEKELKIDVRHPEDDLERFKLVLTHFYDRIGRFIELLRAVDDTLGMGESMKNVISPILVDHFESRKDLIVFSPGKSKSGIAWPADTTAEREAFLCSYEYAQRVLSDLTQRINKTIDLKLNRFLQLWILESFIRVQKTSYQGDVLEYWKLIVAAIRRSIFGENDYSDGVSMERTESVLPIGLIFPVETIPVCCEFLVQSVTDIKDMNEDRDKETGESMGLKTLEMQRMVSWFEENKNVFAAGRDTILLPEVKEKCQRIIPLIFDHVEKVLNEAAAIVRCRSIQVFVDSIWDGIKKRIEEVPRSIRLPGREPQREKVFSSVGNIKECPLVLLEGDDSVFVNIAGKWSEKVKEEIDKNRFVTKIIEGAHLII